MVNMKVIEKFKKKNNLTTKEFCEKCGISVSTYAKIAQGYNFRFNTLMKILLTTHISADNLMGRKVKKKR